MKWNDERFWGFFDEVAGQETKEEKIKMVEEKLQKMSEEDRAELSGLFEESLDQLYTETIYKKLVKLNAGS